MNRSINCTVAIAFSILVANSVTAGEPLPRPDFMLQNTTGYAPAYGYWSGTTAHESFARGRATLIRSIGERHLLDAEARRSNEEAISRRIDNELKAHEVRLARRRMGIAEQNAAFAIIQARRNTQMALNDADRILRGQTSANLETRAEARLRLAKSLIENGRHEQAANWLQEIQSEYTNTAAAQEAAQILEGLDA